MSRCLALLLLASLQCISFIQGFELIRDEKDQFSNPNCVDSVCSKTCSAYNAQCKTSVECRYCICDKDYPTYVSSQQQCAADEDINRNSAPKYSSLAISDDQGDGLITADQGADHKLIVTPQQYSGAAGQRWLYLTTGHIINLKTLQCMDAQQHSNIGVQQCRDIESQQWKCNETFFGLYQTVKGKDLYLSKDGERLFLNNLVPNSRYHWVSNNGKPQKRSICARPDIYKGCYRFRDGRFLAPSMGQIRTCGDVMGCHDLFELPAPIFAGHNYCALRWQESEFLVENKPWQNISDYENDFTISETNNKSEVTLKVHENATRRWSGALVKLQLRCQNTSTQKFEEHCIMFKFPGKYKLQNDSRESKQDGKEVPVTKRKRRDSCKRTTVALSVITCLLAVLLVFAVLKIVRRKLRRWGRRRRDDFITQAEPMAEEEP